MNLSILIPSYNEEKRILPTIKKIEKYLKNHKNLSYEIIVIDDGSTDQTVNVIKKKFKHVKIVKNNKNRGKGYSATNGFLNAKGDLVLVTDADLSTPITELSRFLQYTNRFDIVIGSRKLPNSKIREAQPWYRILAGNIFPMLVKLFVLKGIHDTQCGFKLYKGKRCLQLFKMQTLEGFSFEVELLYLAQRKNMKIKELGVIWNNDADSKVQFVKHSIRMFKDIFKIKQNEKQGLYD